MNALVYAAWIETEAAYQSLKAMCEDKENFGDSFGAWTKQAEQTIEAYRRQWVSVTKIKIDPDVFALWCRANSHRPNAAARSKFAAIHGHTTARN